MSQGVPGSTASAVPTSGITVACGFRAFGGLDGRGAGAAAPWDASGVASGVTAPGVTVLHRRRYHPTGPSIRARIRSSSAATSSHFVRTRS